MGHRQDEAGRAYGRRHVVGHRGAPVKMLACEKRRESFRIKGVAGKQQEPSAVQFIDAHRDSHLQGQPRAVLVPFRKSMLGVDRTMAIQPWVCLLCQGRAVASHQPSHHPYRKSRHLACGVRPNGRVHRVDSLMQWFSLHDPPSRTRAKPRTLRPTPITTTCSPVF